LLVIMRVNIKTELMLIAKNSAIESRKRHGFALRRRIQGIVYVRFSVVEKDHLRPTECRYGI